MYIVYGSQNGNAESVAKNVYDRLENTVLPKTLISLDETLELFRHKHFERPFFIVLSTTGNGEVPFNAEKWWKFLKNRNLDKSHCCGCQFYVLGIGDSNYSHFCGAAKKVQRRLSELGASLMSEMVLIDDSIDDYDQCIFESLIPLTTQNPILVNSIGLF